MLWLQAPYARAWCIQGTLLAQALSDGFDSIGRLQARGVIVTAWTLDAARPQALEIARQLRQACVDRIASNNPRALAEALGGGALGNCYKALVASGRSRPSFIDGRERTEYVRLRRRGLNWATAARLVED